MTGAEPEALVWSVNLGDGQPKRRLVVAWAALFVALFAFAFLRNVVASLVGVAAVFLSTAELFLPVRYKVDADGAQSKCGWSVSEIKWADVCHVVESDEGVKLSPVPEQSRVAPFRGVYLRFSGNRDAVLGTIRALQENHADSVGQRTDG